jgi:hypothetical protein
MFDYDTVVDLLKQENGFNQDIPVTHVMPVDGKHLSCFIDGGNAEIISAPNLSLQLVKVVAIFMDDNKLVSINHNASLFLLKAKTGGFEAVEIGKDKFELTTTKDIREAGDIVRNLCELKLCKQISSEYSGLIVKDGGFDCNTVLEKAEISALNKICGLSKTSMELADNASVTGLSNHIAGCWYIDNHTNYIVKLNQYSAYSFKLELRGLDIQQAMQTLISNSKDITYPGYPYGLILVDRFARVSNEQVESLKRLLETKCGKDWKNVQQMENSLNAHSVLDKMVF